MAPKKKILTIITVFEDGSTSIIPPHKVRATDDPIGPPPNDPDNDGDDDTGGENPLEPPGNP